MSGWLLPGEYFITALRLCRELTKNIYIFCQDIEYARELFKREFMVMFVSNQDYSDFEQYFMMSACRHQIISNSSYSWWSAYLNNNQSKIVIAPEYKMFSGDFYPDEFVKIKVSPDA
ncbi:hypothetical protein AGMMS49992_27780 [Clostridia bacterium]|nr:hypothetical protein AGMMS49992_27780 [Clostridia bacterium]